MILFHHVKVYYFIHFFVIMLLLYAMHVGGEGVEHAVELVNL